jgi:hypothetical protein
MKTQFPSFFKRWLGVYIVLLSIIFTANANGQQKANNENMGSLHSVLSGLKMAVEKKDFETLKSFTISSDQKLIWDICGHDDIGPGDAEAFKYPFNEIVKRLSTLSEGTTIFINKDIQMTPWSSTDNIYNVFIDTEGWVGEYPYLSFFYRISKDGKRHDWLGICYSSGPRLRRSKATRKYEERYYREPTLPRPGPRIFRDDNALKARIKEIIYFKSFDALKPYAINQKIRFGECSSNLLERGIQGKDVSVDQVVELLKEKAKGAVGFEFLSRGKYLETSGWPGEHQYVLFEFTSQGGKGTTWTGMGYCRKSLKTIMMGN